MNSQEKNNSKPKMKQKIYPIFVTSSWASVLNIFQKKMQNIFL